MAVKVKIKHKPPTRVRFSVKDFAHRDEARARIIGVGIGFGFIAVVFAVALLVRIELAEVWGAWVVIALAYYVIGGSGKDARQWGIGRSGAAAPAALADMVSKQARALGVAARAAASPTAPTLATVKGTIVVPESLRQRLSPAEMWALIAREMGHIKAGNVGLRNLLRHLDRQEGLLRLLGLPLLPLARALSAWRWYAELSADCMGLILTRNRKPLAAALLKQAAMGTANIDLAEVDDYLGRNGAIAAEGAELTTHYKLGEALRMREDLMQRLRAIAQYAESPEYRQACDKLDAAYREAQKTTEGIPAPPSA